MLKALKKIINDDYIIDFNQILYVVFFLYVLASHCANHTIIIQVISIVFLILEAIMIIKSRKLYLTSYTVIAVLFVLYCLFQNFAGISINNAQSMWMIKTLLVNIILNFAVICYLITGDNIYSFPKVYSQTGFIYCVYMFVTNISTLGSKRLGWGQPRLFNLGGTYQSNEVGFVLAFAFVMYMYRILVQKQRYCIGFAALCACGAFLSGSRKAMLIVLIGTFLLAYFFYEGKNKLKIIIGGALAVGLMYVIIMNVPVFYNTVGYRFDAFVDGTKSGEQTEGSAIVREHLIEVAKEAFAKRPIKGHGLACFQTLDGTYNLYAHNNFLELLVDVGIIGFIIYYSTYLIALVRIVKSHFRKMKIATLAMTCFVIFIAMEYAFVTYYERPFQIIVMYACAVGIITKKEYKLYVESGASKLEQESEVYVDEFGEERQLIS